MQIQDRSYSGKTFRPKPQYLIESSLKLMVVSTAWGAPEAAPRVNHLIIESLKQGFDEEQTELSSQPTELWSEGAFHIKNALSLANDSVFTTENKISYEVIVETSIILLKGSILSWAQVGGPHILASHPKGLQPLAYEYDWAWQLFSESPLITNGLGLKKACQINSGSIHLTSESFVTLLERSYIPGSFFKTTSPDLAKMTQCLVGDESEIPFWMGIITF